jgi:phosphoribosylanthranilate isomerase
MNSSKTNNVFSALKIKVCGMREKENIRALIGLNPDYIGFIFHERSKRYVGELFDPDITDLVPEHIEKVGVFVDADPDYVDQKINQHKLHYAQLHGNESPEYCKKLTNRGIQIIKAFSVDDEFSFAGMNEYIGCCHYFLFDTRSHLAGGSGKKFNWKMLDSYTHSKSFFLSGGIGPDDHREVAGLSHLNIHALDINSRFEMKPGYKNIGIVKKFIEKIRTGNDEI